MFANFIGPKSFWDTVKSDVTFLICGAVVIAPIFMHLLEGNAFNYLFQIFDSFNNRGMDDSAKEVRADHLKKVIIISLFILCTYLMSKLIESLNSLIERIIDRLNVLRILWQSEDICINTEKKYRKAEQKFYRNWCGYLRFRVEYACKPVGQKYLSDVVGIFVLQMALFSTGVLFQLVMLCLNFQGNSTIYIGVYNIAIYIIIFFHHLTKSLSLHLLAIAVMIASSIFLLIDLFFPLPSVLGVCLAASIFSSFMFSCSLRCSWALYEIRRELLKSKML